MIKPNEIRINNIVIYNNCQWVVCSIDSPNPRIDKRFDGKYVVEIYNGGSVYVPLEDLSPIPITEQILIEFGAEKINHIHGYSFYTFSKSKTNKIHLDIYDNKTLYMGYYVNHCSYVHQLQNLYLALTGEELKRLSPDPK